MRIRGKGAILIAVGAVALLLAVACGAEPVPTPTPRPPTSTPTPVRATPTPTPGGVATPTPGPTEGDATRGKALYSTKACNACHGANGEGMAGLAPKLSGIYGGMETLADGSQVTVDDAYLTESIRNPTAKTVKGFQPLMSPVTLTEAEMKDIIAYIVSLK